MVKFVGLEVPEEYLTQPDALRQAITPRTRLFVLNSPSNPTGGVMPLAALEAFRDHGRAAATLIPGRAEPEATLASLERAGISLAEVTARLLADGIRQFDEAMNELLAALEKARRAANSQAGKRRGPVPAR